MKTKLHMLRTIAISLMSAALLALLIALGVPASVSAQEGDPPPATTPSDLQYMMDDSPPFTFNYMGRPTGLGTEVLQRIWKEMGVPPQPIKTVPWFRAIKYAETTPNVCLFLAEWSPERAGRFKFATPVYASTISVLVDTKQTGSMGCLDALRNLHIALPRMENVENELVRRGTPPENLDRSGTTGTAVRMVVHQRTQAIAGEESAIRQHLVHLAVDERRFERVCVFNRREMGFLFSNDVPDEPVERFQKALDTVRNSQEYKELIQRYIP